MDSQGTLSLLAVSGLGTDTPKAQEFEAVLRPDTGRLLVQHNLTLKLRE